ncbi:fimbrial protein [Kalamiella sp. sgz302252]|uniref:fimbrial protein n=1 Tax=Pantoea sp. sgz302252 TaxID=3341827 RepID=UPI0036D27942
MKKICTATAALSLFLAGNALAITDSGVPGGTITFSGAVSDTTCDITTNNGSDFTVNVSPVTHEEIGTSPGVVSAAATPFTINVAGCSGFNAASIAAQPLNITFTGTSVSDDMRYLKNETGTAEGVGIAITRDGSTLLAMNEAIDTGLATTRSGNGTFDTGAAGNISFYANYYNYGGADVSAGSVMTTATYTFSYE